MPDPTPAPPAPTRIRIGETEHVLRFDYAALCALEAAVGNDEAVESIGSVTPSLRRPRDLLFAGLHHEDRNRTLEGAAALLDQFLTDGGSIGELSRILSEALAGSPFLRSLTRQRQDRESRTPSSGPSSTSEPTSPSASGPPPAASG